MPSLTPTPPIPGARPTAVDMARLEQACPPGRILVSRTVWDGHGADRRRARLRWAR